MSKPNLPDLPPLSLDRVMNFRTDVSWGISKPERFNELMTELISLVAPGFHLSDNLFTWARNLSFLEDPAFRTAWEGNLDDVSDHAIGWRRYILACAAFHGVQLDGDFVECGVQAGTAIKTIVDYLGGTSFPKTFWGYDTFDYNPVEGHAFDGQVAGNYDRVCARFAGYPQVRLIRGLLPDSFSQGAPDKVAFLHIDMNNVQGEVAALEYLFDRVVPGGIVILDDYEWSFYRRQKHGEDPWFASRGYRVFPLPTGQGLVIKR